MQLGNQGDGELSPTSSGHIESKPPHKPGKRWKKGAMKGKGGPQNAACEYRGVRQRTWGKWVAEIREPKKRARLWLGSFATAKQAALAYDIAARKLYGPLAELNLPAHESAGLDSLPPSQPAAEIKSSISSPTEQPPHSSHNIGIPRMVGAGSESSAEATSSSQPPMDVSSLPEFHQLQYYAAEGHQSGSGEHLKDIHMFLNQFDSDYPTPSLSVDDDENDSNSSLSPSNMESAKAPFNPTWAQDERLDSQFLNLELQSVVTDPLLPENLDLWDTHDESMLPGSDHQPRP